MAAALIGIGLAYDRYHRQGKVPEAKPDDAVALRFVRDQFGTDTLWNKLYRNGLQKFLGRNTDWMETYGVNGAFAAGAGILNFLAAWISGWQNGRLGRYAAIVISGSALLVLWLAWGEGAP
jgi:hypothetical protein